MPRPPKPLVIAFAASGSPAAAAMRSITIRDAPGVQRHRHHLRKHPFEPPRRLAHPREQVCVARRGDGRQRRHPLVHFALGGPSALGLAAAKGSTREAAESEVATKLRSPGRGVYGGRTPTPPYWTSMSSTRIPGARTAAIRAMRRVRIQIAAELHEHGVCRRLRPVLLTGLPSRGTNGSERRVLASSINEPVIGLITFGNASPRFPRL